MKNLAALIVIAFMSQFLRCQEPSENYTVRANSRLVFVDVVVRGRDGLPVKGLTKSDFEVMEGKEKQSIAFFVDNSHSINVAPEIASPVSSKEFFTNERPAEPYRGRTILLLDLLNTELKDRPLARQAMLKFVARQMPRNEAIAVFVLGNDLLQIQDFTSDMRLLAAAILNDHTNPVDPSYRDRDADNAGA